MKILFVLFVILIYSIANAGNIIIQNDFYQLNWDGMRLSIKAKKVQNCHIKSIELMPKIINVEKRDVNDPIWGKGQSLNVHHEGSITSFMLFKKLNYVAVRKSLHNTTEEKQVIDELPILKAHFDFNKPAEKLVSRGTAGLKPVDEEWGSYVFNLIGDPADGKGILFGWVSSDRGQGIVIPLNKNNKPGMRTHVDYGDLRLASGKKEKGELLLIGIYKDIRDGMEGYADAIVKYYSIKLRPLPSVYCTWYHSRASDEKRIATNTDFVSRYLQPYGLSVMQIDDKWQSGERINGPKKNFETHDPDGPYPNGMKATADYIKSKGMVPGLWLMPFAGTWMDPYFKDKQDLFYKTGHGDQAAMEKIFKKSKKKLPDNPAEVPYMANWAGTAIDPSNPDARAYIFQMIKRICRDWGYEYLKMDGIHLGIGARQQYVDNQYQKGDLGKTIRHNPDMTPIEAYRKGQQVIRKAAGDDVFFLGCCMVQNLRCFGTTFGHLDAMRVGPDNGSKVKGIAKGPRYSTRYYFLDKRVWYNDPDPMYFRPSYAAEHAKMLATWVTLAGSLGATSYDYYNLPPERIDMLRRTMPSHNLKTSRPVDFLENDIAHVWLLTDNSKGVARTVVGHYNWDDKNNKILETPLEKLGLNPDKTYIGFDYWDNQFIPCFTEKLKSDLPPLTCRNITIYQQKKYPQLVSTSRHITQGIIDVLEEKWDGKGELSGISKIVEEDPYELRIAVSKEKGGWLLKSAEVDDKDVEVTSSQTGSGVRVVLKSAESREVKWKLKFQKSL